MALVACGFKATFNARHFVHCQIVKLLKFICEKSLPFYPQNFLPQHYPTILLLLTAGWEDVTVHFLCGADLLESFSVPGLWEDEDVC